MTLTNATLYLAGTRKVTEVGISLLSATMTVEEWEDNVVIIDHRFCIYNHRTTKTNQKYPSVNL